jgi:hypothetical protein
MKKKIFAYYEPLLGSRQNEQLLCANIWKESWENNGWKPVIMNRSHAQGSNLYIKLVKKINELYPRLTSEQQIEFPIILARFSRWCALHAAGGGWMSDYDVLNKTFHCNKSEDLEKTGSILVLSNQPSFVFYVSQDIATAAITRILSDELYIENNFKTEDKIFNQNGKLDDILNDVFHADKTSKIIKSEQMKNIFTNNQKII